jgi:hypothetical protein
MEGIYGKRYNRYFCQVSCLASYPTEAHLRFINFFIKVNERKVFEQKFPFLTTLLLRGNVNFGNRCRNVGGLHGF